MIDHVVDAKSNHVLDIVLVGQNQERQDSGVGDRDLASVQVLQELGKHEDTVLLLAQNHIRLLGTGSMISSSSSRTGFSTCLTLGPIGIHEHHLEDIGRRDQQKSMGWELSPADLGTRVRTH